jgi:ribonuclease HIII
VSQITNLSFPFPEAKWRELKIFLEGQGVEISPIPYGFQAQFEATKVNWYSSGKLLLQGKGAPDFAEELYVRGWISAGLNEEPVARIGVDESGKGDFFGPMVIAGALVHPEIENELIRLGVRDSKTVSEISVQNIVKQLRGMIPYSTVVISPKKYNELHLKMNNVNRMLAWGHARAIENLLLKHEAKLAVSDQFGDESYLKNALMQKGKQVKLIQRHRAEADLAVAAASIFARAEFLKRMDELSEKAGIVLPRGASEQVIEAGKKLVAKLGVNGLDEFAKTHFKTTQQLIPK